MTTAVQRPGFDLPLRVQLWREHCALIGRWVSRLKREPFTLIGTIILPVAWLLLRSLNETFLGVARRRLGASIVSVKSAGVVPRCCHGCCHPARRGRLIG